jgi:hypothetical protein
VINEINRKVDLVLSKLNVDDSRVPSSSQLKDTEMKEAKP